MLSPPIPPWPHTIVIPRPAPANERLGWLQELARRASKVVAGPVQVAQWKRASEKEDIVAQVQRLVQECKEAEGPPELLDVCSNIEELLEDGPILTRPIGSLSSLLPLRVSGCKI